MANRRNLALGGAIVAFLAAMTAWGGGTASIEWMSGGHGGGVNSLAATPDGALLITTSGLDETIKIWDRADQHLIQTIGAAFSEMNDVAISPDGATIAAGQDWLPGFEDATLKIWSVASGGQLRGLNVGVSYDVDSVAFSPDGTMVAAACWDNNVRIFSTSGGLVHTLSGHAGFVNSVAWSPDGSLVASASNDNTVKLWNVATGTLHKTLTGHTFFVMSVAFRANGSQVVSGSWDGKVKIWNARTGTITTTLSAPSGSAIDAVAVLDGALVAGAGSDATPDAKIRIWDVNTGMIVQTISAHPAGVFDLEYTDGVLRSGGADGLSQEWDPTSGAKLATFGERRAVVNDVVFSDDSSVFAAATSLNNNPSPSAHHGDIEMWDPATGELVRRLTGHTDVVNAAAFSPDGSLLVSGAGSPPPSTTDQTAKVWDVATGTVLTTVPGHFGGTVAVEISDDESFIVTAGRDALMKVWALPSGSLVESFSNAVQDLAFSPDGTILAIASGDTVELWDPADWSLIHTIDTDAGVDWISWSSDGSMIAGALAMYGDNVRVWSVPDGAELHVLPGDQDGFMQSVSFAPDGTGLVAASGYTHTIQVWDLTSETLVDQYTAETGWGLFPKTTVALSPNGAWLGYGRNDATIVMATSPFGAAGVVGDLDGDADVDGADLGVLLAAWGACGGCEEDLDGNGEVDGADLGVLLSQWS
jgi:WD40 repeat protein